MLTDGNKQHDFRAKRVKLEIENWKAKGDKKLDACSNLGHAAQDQEKFHVPRISTERFVMNRLHSLMRRKKIITFSPNLRP